MVFDLFQLEYFDYTSLSIKSIPKPTCPIIYIYRIINLVSSSRITVKYHTSLQLTYPNPAIDEQFQLTTTNIYILSVNR